MGRVFQSLGAANIKALSLISWMEHEITNDLQNASELLQIRLFKEGRVKYERLHYSSDPINELNFCCCNNLSHSEHEGSRRMKTELLVQMDGLAKTDDLVFLLAASNLPW